MSQEEEMRQSLQAMGFSEKQIQMGLKFSSLDTAIEFITSRPPDRDSDLELAASLAELKFPETPVEKTESYTITEFIPLDDVCKEMVLHSSATPTERNFPSAGNTSFDADEDLQKAIQESMMEVGKLGVDVNTFEVINPFERTRDIGIPVGLKNIGNTCYANSILQSYFAIPQFRDKILSLPFVEELTDNDPRKLSHELQSLFAYLILSERKYVDPSNIIRAIANNDGKQMHIGHQEDPTEFSILFFERLRESIAALYKKQEEESITQKQEISDDIKVEDQHDSNDKENKMEVENDENKMDIEKENKEPENKNKEDKKIEDKKEAPQIPFLQELFATYSSQKVFAEEADGEKVELSQKEEFMHIILDISHQDLYSSLDEYTSSSTIDVFTSPKGHITTAEKLVFFTSLSKVLTFQLQRVGYDSESKSAVKKHTHFEFPKELYMDRYIEPNFEITMRKRKEIQILKEKKLSLQEKLNRYLNYNQSNYPIETFLKETIHYLAEKNQNNHIASFLSTQREKIIDKIAKKQKKIEILQSQIDSAYDDMQSELYHLHAVLVHDGEAGSGHYWAFLYQPAKKSWFKFNDITVTEVNEEIVWKDSFGGHLTASAYCIIYLHSSISDQSGVVDLENKVEYSLIPPQLQAAIAEDNMEFQNEKKQWEEKKNNSLVAVNNNNNKENSNEEKKTDEASVPIVEINEQIIAQFGQLHSQKLFEIIESQQRFESIPFINPQLQSFANFLISTNHHDLMQVEATNIIYNELFGVPLTKVKPPDELVNQLPSVPFKIPNSYYVLYQMYENCRENLELLTISFHSHLLDDYSLAVKRYVKVLERDVASGYAISKREREICHYLRHAIEALSEEATCELHLDDRLENAIKKAALVAAGSTAIPLKHANNIRENMKEKWLPLIEAIPMQSLTEEARKYANMVVSIYVHLSVAELHANEAYDPIHPDTLWGQYVMLKEQLDAKLQHGY